MRKIFSLLGILCLALLSFTPLILPWVYDNPQPIAPLLDGVFPSADPNNIGSYSMVSAFPNLTFNDVSVIVSAPSNDPSHPTAGQLFVGTAGGMIYSLPNSSSATIGQRNTVLNFTAEVYTRGEAIAPTHPRDSWDTYLDGGLCIHALHREGKWL